MIDTEEYYGGTYPSPPEYEEKEEDYDDYMADVIHDEMILKEITEIEES